MMRFRLYQAHEYIPTPRVLHADDMSVQRTMKEGMGLEDAEVEERLTKLVTLLPGLLSKLPVIKAKVVIMLAKDISVSGHPGRPLCPGACAEGDFWGAISLPR